MLLLVVIRVRGGNQPGIHTPGIWVPEGGLKIGIKRLSCPSLMFRIECSKARKYLKSNGLDNHMDAEIINYMQCKQP